LDSHIATWCHHVAARKGSIAMGIGRWFKSSPGAAPPSTHDGYEKAPTAAAGPRATSRDAVLAAATSRVVTWSLRLVIVAAAAAVLAWVLAKLWVVVLPVVFGLLLATVLWPPARLLRRFVPPAAAALVVLLSGFVLLAGLGTLLGSQVAGQWQRLTDAVVAGLDDLRALITGPPLNLGAGQVDDVINEGIERLQSNAGSILGGVLSGVGTAGSFVLNAVLAVVLCFFFLKDGSKFLPWISSLVGSTAAPHVVEVARRSWESLSGFIRAQAAVGLVDAVAIGIWLAVLGVPLVLPLVVLIFFGAFIPIVGAFVTGALAALVALVTEGLTGALIVVALVLVVQQLEGNVLQPLLMGRTLQLHGAMVILAVTAGGSLAGIVGAFLAVPVLAVATTIVRYGREQLDRSVSDEPRGSPGTAAAS
jgi:predicted PurR-regulated permease PerM